MSIGTNGSISLGGLVQEDSTGKWAVLQIKSRAKKIKCIWYYSANGRRVLI